MSPEGGGGGVGAGGRLGILGSPGEMVASRDRCCWCDEECCALVSLLGVLTQGQGKGEWPRGKGVGGGQEKGNERTNERTNERANEELNPDPAWSVVSGQPDEQHGACPSLAEHISSM